MGHRMGHRSGPGRAIVWRMWREYLADCRRRVDALEAERVGALREGHGVETFRVTSLSLAIAVARFRVALIESLPWVPGPGPAA